MAKHTQPISFAGAQLEHTRHVCAFFNSEDEEYRVLLPFIRDGFAHAHKAVHIVSAERRERHVDRLTEAGIDAAALEQSGQLEIQVDADAYLQHGRFDQDRMLRTFEQIASGSGEGPYPLSRIICQMEWASEHPGCVHDLIEFEARVNDLWSCHEDAVICVYDLAKFNGELVMDIIRTHPMIIVGGILHQNPFFVPPREFLREMHERRARQASSPGDSG